MSKAPLTIPFIYEQIGDYAPGLFMVSAAWLTLAFCMLLAGRPNPEPASEPRP
jgi:hypothetical protein